MGTATKFRAFKFLLAAGAASCVFSPACGAVAAAEESAGVQVDVNLKAGKMSDALLALGRAGKVQIVFPPESVARRKVKALRGRMTVDEALSRLLRDTGLSVRQMNGGAYVISGPTLENSAKAKRLLSDLEANDGRVNGQTGISEILVQGKRSWSLNTDIPRTKDEAQPYTVFSREEIKRSGAPDLETFFRDFLSSNVEVKTSGGTGARDSTINLRGLGANSTLILIDGRRVADPNPAANAANSGLITQSSINGIPLEQIERVEVLATSAAGQYGSNAVGGVINIILRRDFKGVEFGAYVGGTTDGHAMDRRFSGAYTFPLLNNKFSVTLTGSWQNADPLYAKDRPFTQERAGYILDQNPAYFNNPSNIQGGVPISTTPNIISATGGQLTLKQQFAVNGVTALNSNRTYIPLGFGGVGVEGASALGAALLANAGKQNLEPGSGPTNNLLFGDHYSLLAGRSSKNASITTRGDVTDWFNVYLSGSYAKFVNELPATDSPTSIQLKVDSPFNPFQQIINVSIPSTEYTITKSIYESKRLVGGFIFKLPYSWQANLDATRDWGTSTTAGSSLRQFSQGYNQRWEAGLIDVLRDPAVSPLNIEYDPEHRITAQLPSKSAQASYYLKFTGPLGFLRLPGGKPLLTLSAESQRKTFGDSVYVSNYPTGSSISYTPARSQSSKSVYSEIVLPLISADNDVPFIREFELRVAGRYDEYKGFGANTNLRCLTADKRYLTSAELEAPCPPPGVTIPSATTRNHSVNPVIAAKWSLSKDIAFRGSYATGYTPPYLNRLVQDPDQPSALFPGIANLVSVSVQDPERGNEQIGRVFFPGLPYYVLDASTGGNVSVEPQTSTSWSFGTIITPQFVPELTLRADWTSTTIHGAYYDPSQLLNAFGFSLQDEFDLFLKLHPERFTREAPTPGDRYSVGKIIAFDATTANLSVYKSKSLDFSADYRTALGGGTLSLIAAGTLLLDLKSQVTELSPLKDRDGVVSASGFGFGDSLRFRGTATVNYSTDTWGLGARVRYFSGYYLTTPDNNGVHPIDINQGTNRIGGSAFFDLFGRYVVRKGTELQFGLNNVLNKRPPLDVTRLAGYAAYGDPKLRSFFVNLTQRF